MQIHTYGAVFGIIVSMYLSKEGLANNLKQTSSYTTTIISFIGTLFLWIYWPSFNSALAVDTSDVTIREVASTNTVFALMASTLAAFIFSMMYNHKLNIRDIAFASLSGAVVIASCANIIINIGGVMLIAFFTGWIATSGYVYLSRYLQIYGFHDTTGTVNLFFIPGLLSGIFSSVLIAIYATAPKYLNIITTYADRTSYTQGGYQLACLGTTIGFAIAFGIIGGLILCRLAVYHKEELFEDRTYWELIQDE
jgi:ammonium transporter Rh